jgi:hypothetical protein
MFPSRPSPSGWYPEMARDRSYALEVARAMGLIAPRTSENTCGNGEPSGKKKIGRPRSDKPKPWDGTGLSKSEYYRKKSKGEV